jgi:predicted permease
LGLLIAVGGIRFLTLLMANGRENFTLRAELNWEVLGLTLLLSLGCGVLFGLAPAIQATRADVMPALKEGRADAARAQSRGGLVRLPIAKTLVVCQVAISLLLLMAAGLFVRTLSNLQSIQLGYNREQVLMVDLDARAVGHRDPEILPFYGDLRKRLETIPGVRNVTLSHASLIKASRRLPITVSGVQADATYILNVGASFFTTMQIPIREGREIDDRDQPGALPALVVNELFAKRYFGNESPIGRSITVGNGQRVRNFEVVGVCANTRYGGVKGEYVSIVYIPFTQQTAPAVRQMTYEIRAAGNTGLLARSVRDVVHQADARIPLTNIRTAAVEIDQLMSQEILFARLCSGFALLALIIAGVGLYGTMAYTVARRTSEIGIRMALGARRGTVTWMVLREACLLAAIGLVISVPTILATSKFVQSFLYGVTPNDPKSLLAGVAILIGAVLLAGYGPARRAARIDPLVALREQ